MPDPKKKVLMFLLNDFNMDNRVLKEAISLQKHNYQVYIIATHFNKKLKRIQEYEPGIIVIRLNIIRPSFSKYVHFWIKASRLFKNSSCDIIVCHDLNTLPIGVYLRNRMKKPPKLIYDSHEFFPAMLQEIYGSIPYWIFISLEKRLIDKPDYITTDSPSRSANLKHFYKFSSPITHIYNSYYVDILDIKKLPYKSQPADLQLVIMGNVVANTRGFEMLPVFVKELKRLANGTDPHVRVLVVGDGSYRQTIQNKIHKEGHDDVVKFYGNLPYKKAIALIKNFDIGLILFKAVSLNPEHAGPNRIFDYMAAELAVITSDLFEISRVVKKEKIGWIIPQDYPIDLAKLVYEIKEKKEDLLPFKKNSKTSYIESYSWNKMEEKILRIYDYLLND